MEAIELIKLYNKLLEYIRCINIENKREIEYNTQTVVYFNGEPVVFDKLFNINTIGLINNFDKNYERLCNKEDLNNFMKDLEYMMDKLYLIAAITFSKNLTNCHATLEYIYRNIEGFANCLNSEIKFDE
nr:MAG TPA: hypothetical protein [Caudoviricetes sp.]